MGHAGEVTLYEGCLHRDIPGLLIIILEHLLIMSRSQQLLTGTDRQKETGGSENVTCALVSAQHFLPQNGHQSLLSYIQQ